MGKTVIHCHFRARRRRSACIGWRSSTPSHPVASRAAIFGLYCSYVTKKYGNAIVVFDGYDDMSTKNMTHQGRAAGKVGATVTFTENMKVTLKKDNFLANPKYCPCT